MNTYQFEEVRDQDTGALLWVGAREQQSPWRFFVWVANTGSWHRYQEFEPGADWVDGVDFKEIDAAAVPALVESVRRIDERRFGWVMDEFRAQPAEEILTHAQLGLDAGRGARPTRTVSLEDIPTDNWMTLKTYGPDGESKARSLASDIRLGKRKGWPAGSVLSCIELVDDSYEVRVKRSPVETENEVSASIAQDDTEEAVDGRKLGNEIFGDQEFMTAQLTVREQETLRLYAAGHTRSQIAASMNVSTSTVDASIRRIREKYSATGRNAASEVEAHRTSKDGRGVLPS